MKHISTINSKKFIIFGNNSNLLLFFETIIKKVGINYKMPLKIQVC